MKKTLRAAARRHLATRSAGRYGVERGLFRACLDRLEGLERAWRRSRDEDAVHDFRVGIRRVRVLLRVFEADARFPEADRLRKLLGEAADRLGAVRDIDVISGLLQDKSGDDAGIWLEGLEQEKADRARIADQFLFSSAWRRVGGLSARFMARIDRQAAGKVNEPIGVFVDREVQNYRKRIRKAAELARARKSEPLHAFRIRLRRLRYLGEVFAPIADPEQANLFAAVYECEQALGRLHDSDLVLERFEGAKGKAARDIRRRFRDIRDRRLAAFRLAWNAHKRLILGKA